MGMGRDMKREERLCIKCDKGVKVVDVVVGVREVDER